MENFHRPFLQFYLIYITDIYSAYVSDAMGLHLRKDKPLHSPRQIQFRSSPIRCVFLIIVNPQNFVERILKSADHFAILISMQLVSLFFCPEYLVFIKAVNPTSL